uniref:Acyl-CoA dehydrogenase/oxidase C-terminal domain-containing protein n=1 Tax=Panagrolaimus sp. PS1159 TaxID=55785 RepID=A0AC35GH80_9BILA
MSLTLARSIENGQVQTGSHGLSLFYLQIRDFKNGPLNGIQMIRLKNKLRTRQLPTAELLLDGVKAIKLSEEGRGVPSLANTLNITRIHNAIASVAGMRGIVSLARDYSTRRIAFGNTLNKWPLHLKILADLEIKIRAGIECFGGQGYIEDTGIPGILRDAQVTTIWEGTTNVLSLDVLRVFATTKFAAAEAFVARIKEIILNTKNGNEQLQKVGDALESALNQLFGTLKTAQKNSDFPQNLQRAARDISMTMGNIYSGAL